MRAKYQGECARCGNRFWPGDEITRTDGGRWAAVDCDGCKGMEIAHALVQRMKPHGVGLGCWGIDDNLKPTFSRYEFFMEAKKAGEISPEEERLLLLYWRGILDRDLSD